MTTSRREFFKTAAMGAVGAGAAFGTVAAEAKAAAQIGRASCRERV